MYKLITSFDIKETQTCFAWLGITLYTDCGELSNKAKISISKRFIVYEKLLQHSN